MSNFYLLAIFKLIGVLFLLKFAFSIADFNWNDVRFFFESLYPWLSSGSRLINMFILVIFLFFNIFIPIKPFNHMPFAFPLIIKNRVKMFFLSGSLWHYYHSVLFISLSFMRRYNSELNFLLFESILWIAKRITVLKFLLIINEYFSLGFWFHVLLAQVVKTVGPIIGFFFYPFYT